MFLIFIAVLLGETLAQTCDTTNCHLPTCRCFSDPNAPGNIPISQIPQMVVITMDYILNDEFAALYNKLFDLPLTNPNGCPFHGTFYIQDVGTKSEIVKSFYDKGFEIGINSWNGTLPHNAAEWFVIMKVVKDFLESASVSDDKILGCRAPELSPDGNNQWLAMVSQSLHYEASCVTPDAARYWPFTYDFIDQRVKCNIGNTSTIPFPGIWQVLLPEYEFKGQRCASPEACSDVNSKQDAFDMLFENLNKHRVGNRTPFVIAIDPSWIQNIDKVEGTIQFLEYIRLAFSDVWIVTTNQMLQWVKDPHPLFNITNFAPWQCK